MQPSQITHQYAADHDVMEVGDDKVGICDVNVDSDRGQYEAGQSANGKQPDKAKSIEHWSGEGNGTLVEGGCPVEDFDGGGHTYHETEERKNHCGIERDAGDKQVMRPDQESKDGDGHARHGDKLVAEHAFAREAGHQFADHSHRGQDHDVNGRMRVKPEQVLEQNRVPAKSGIEDAKMQETFGNHEHHGDGNHRSAKDHDHAGRIVRPDEQRQTVPGEAGRAHAVDGDDEIESSEDGRKTSDEDRESSFDHIAVAGSAVGGIERPAGIDASVQHAMQEKNAGSDVEVPAQQVDARKGKILRSDHQGYEEVAKNRGYDWNQKEEHHDDTVHGKHLVIGVGLQQVALRCKQFEPDEHGKETAKEEESAHRNQIEERDPLVVRGQEPGLEAVSVVEVVQLRSRSLIYRNCCTRHDYCTCAF